MSGRSTISAGADRRTAPRRSSGRTRRGEGRTRPLEPACDPRRAAPRARRRRTVRLIAKSYAVRTSNAAGRLARDPMSRTMARLPGSSWGRVLRVEGLIVSLLVFLVLDDHLTRRRHVKPRGRVRRTSRLASADRTLARRAKWRAHRPSSSALACDSEPCVVGQITRVQRAKWRMRGGRAADASPEAPVAGRHTIAATRRPPGGAIPHARSRRRVHRRAPGQRPAPDRRRGPPRARRGREHLVQRRLQARGPGQDRLRAPVRARDVPGQRARRQGGAHGARPGVPAAPSTARPGSTAPTTSRRCRRTSWSSRCGSRRTGWARSSTR